MEFAEFERRFDEVRAGRVVGSFPPELQVFELLTASAEEIQQAEAELGVVLPGAYREFMTKYGGGEFLYVDLEPVTELVSVNRVERIPGFVAVAPVGTGDWWGFEVSGGICDERISFWFHDDRRAEPTYADFLAFLCAEGLRFTEPR